MGLGKEVTGMVHCRVHGFVLNTMKTNALLQRVLAIVLMDIITLKQLKPDPLTSDRLSEGACSTGSSCLREENKDP